MAAINTFVPKIFAPMAMQKFRYDPKWIGSTNDRSAEFSAFARGNEIEEYIFEDVSQDFQDDTGQELTPGVMEIVKRNLVIDQSKAHVLKVNRQELTQNVTDILMGYTEWYNYNFRVTFKRLLAARHSAGTPTDHKIAIPVAVGTVTPYSKEHVELVLEAIFQVQEEAIEAGAPDDWVGDIYFSERLMRAIRVYLWRDNPLSGYGAIPVGAMTNGRIPMFAGFRLLGDRDRGNDMGQNGTGKELGSVLFRGVTLQSAIQLEDFVVNRHHLDTNLYPQIKYLYGASVRYPEFAWEISHTVSGN